MNDQFNPDGTDQAEITAKASGRRRLVRGAVSLAPIVLTLRSGALAAASCTGAAKLDKVILEEGGEVPSTSPQVEAGDGCFTKVTACETNVSKLSTDSDSYIKIGNVEVRDGKFYCQTGTTGQTVAILSSASVTSLR